MSYAWRLAGDARVDLRQLEPWLQEEVLDELETLADAPEALRADADGFAAAQLDRRASGTLHIIFIRLHCDSSRQLLTVLGIDDQARPDTNS